MRQNEDDITNSDFYGCTGLEKQINNKSQQDITDKCQQNINDIDKQNINDIDKQNINDIDKQNINDIDKQNINDIDKQDINDIDKQDNNDIDKHHINDIDKQDNNDIDKHHINDKCQHHINDKCQHHINDIDKQNYILQRNTIDEEIKYYIDEDQNKLNQQNIDYISNNMSILTDNTDSNPDKVNLESKSDPDIDNTNKIRRIKSLISGAIAGAFAKLVTSPLSRVTVLMQVMSLKGPADTISDLKINRIGSSTISSSIRKAIREDGILSLWRGVFVSIIHRLPYSGISFLTVSEVKSYTTDWSLPLSSFVSGAIAGGVSVATVYPLDVLRTHVMTETGVSTGKGIFRRLKDIKDKHGFRSLYRGICPSICATIPAAACNFLIYDHLTSKIRSCYFSTNIPEYVCHNDSRDISDDMNQNDNSVKNTSNHHTYYSYTEVDSNISPSIKNMSSFICKYVLDILYQDIHTEYIKQSEDIFKDSRVLAWLNYSPESEFNTTQLIEECKSEIWRKLRRRHFFTSFTKGEEMLGFLGIGSADAILTQYIDITKFTKIDNEKLCCNKSPRNSMQEYMSILKQYSIIQISKYICERALTPWKRLTNIGNIDSQLKKKDQILFEPISICPNKSDARYIQAVGKHYFASLRNKLFDLNRHTALKQIKFSKDTSNIFRGNMIENENLAVSKMIDYYLTRKNSYRNTINLRYSDSQNKDNLSQTVQKSYYIPSKIFQNVYSDNKVHKKFTSPVIDFSKSLINRIHGTSRVEVVLQHSNLWYSVNKEMKYTNKGFPEVKNHKYEVEMKIIDKLVEPIDNETHSWKTATKEALPAIVPLLVGGLAGTVSNTLIYPLDLIRKQMQLNQSRSVLDTAKHIWNTDRKIFGFYRGLVADVIKVGPTVALVFYTYEILNSLNWPILG